jgi:hypothetical protein
VTHAARPRRTAPAGESDARRQATGSAPAGTAAGASGIPLVGPGSRAETRPASDADRFSEAMIAGGVPLSKIIMDIHTGKLLLGDDAKWLWIDLLGATMIGWSTTGLIMWLRSRRARAARLRRSSVALGSPAE